MMTYTYGECLGAMGHMTAGQVYHIHTWLDAANPVMYEWGRYYFSNPPATSNTPAPPLASNKLQSDPCTTARYVSGAEAVDGPSDALLAACGRCCCCLLRKEGRALPRTCPHGRALPERMQAAHTVHWHVPHTHSACMHAAGRGAYMHACTRAPPD